MAHNIQKDSSNIITVTFNERVDLNERITAVEKVCTLVDPSRPIKLLIDVRGITMDMSLDEQQYFGEYLASKHELANAKVALLHKPRNNPNMVINATAYVKGYHVVDFDNQNDANMWLTGEVK